MEKNGEIKRLSIESVRGFLTAEVDGVQVFERKVLDSDVEEKDGKTLAIDDVWVVARLPEDPPGKAWGFVLRDVADVSEDAEDRGATIAVSPDQDDVEATGYDVEVKKAA